MRPYFKTWLTICILIPLVSHANNHDKRLPKVNCSNPTVHNSYIAQISVKQNINRTAQVCKADRQSPHTQLEANNKQISSVLNRAFNMLGTPYRWGGISPSKGFDCSGLVKYAFNDIKEINLPRTSNAMANGHGLKVDRKDLKPCDLIFFKIKSRRVNHVAIYLGNNRFIHAPRTGKSVSINTLKNPFWSKHYTVAKRVLPNRSKQPMGDTLITSG